VTARVPVTVVVPTIGRPVLLAALLDSLAAGDPQPDEVLLVDQSGGPAIATLAAAYTGLAVRCIETAPPNIARAMNAGLAAARNRLCLITNDDITVAPHWVGRAYEHLLAAPAALVTGRVLAGGTDPRRVPSVMTAEWPTDYTAPQPWGLFPGNCAGDRDAIGDLGGFDERPTLRIAAEDNDLAWRWLRAGRTIRYRPDLVVWHHDWREPHEIARRYREYGEGQGAMYAKHLLAGDLAIARYLLADLRRGLRGRLARLLLRRQPHTDWRQGLFPGVAVGFIRGTVEVLRRR
jgi:GT2 family glycosyltransferase